MATERPPVEPVIGIDSREQLLYLLSEAAEIEHNLMCCYLFAAFSLKSSTDEDLNEIELAAVRRWRQAIVAVAVEEMTHLSLVANLSTALGGAAHFSRPNLPSAPGLYPSGVVVKLAPFDRQTLQHFLFLERPEGSDIPDGDGYSAPSSYVRETVTGKCMPSAQDYFTVGHLYRGLRDGIAAMVARLGEAATFVGDPSAQIGPEVVTLPGLCAVTDLKSALIAVETIVRQGEGASVASAESHFGRFSAIAHQYDELLTRRSTFVPHRPVARNPVMRRPPIVGERVFVEAPAAARVLDLANAVYGQTLRCLAQAFGRSGDPEPKRLLIDTAIELMFTLAGVAEALTLLPASPLHPGQTTGVSFAMLRDVARVPEGEGEWRMLSERLGELATAAASLSSTVPSLGSAAEGLRALKLKFDRRRVSQRPSDDRTQAIPRGAGTTPASQAAPASQIVAGVEIAPGQALTLKFEAKRCIHSRFCVLGLPQVYKANVQGPWIDPDAATVEANIAVAHSCPSGAIRYQRHDGGPEEAAPLVNLIALRENGPYAFRAPLMLNGEFIGFRATLCRCGASKNKPYCDGSHKAEGFSATGEPPTGEFAALATRAGPLAIVPQRNGPLAVTGNIEIISGTGRTIMKAGKAALCRCGHSSAKPYCDGTHARIGFVAD
jgi:CDGSH-type Zn-finger protein/uncharacterized Fe-S cluster protein YjdI